MARAVVGLFLAALVAAGSAGAADKTDRVQGNWEGKYTASSASGPMSAKIIAEGDGAYRALIEAKTDSGEVHQAEMSGKGNGQQAVFMGTMPLEEGDPIVVLGTIDAQKFDGRVIGMDEPVTFQLSRVEKKPSTLGMAPPADAIVLFDGTNQDKWQAVPAKWGIDENAMTVGAPTMMTTDEYGAGTYHIEFRTPLMASQRGQARGNSGVYLLGRYEVQVLDSFGLPPADNEAGGIYKKAVPKVNASLPPGEWQTYDIIFHPAKFDAAGVKTQDATITVKHNDIVIHDNARLDSPTPGGVADKDAQKGPLLLQNHGNPVSYRNIWYQPAAE